ncbi:hypothetical protein CSKR_109653 [Clonorchis sinensis]|uniref:Uncharacterized protein n=1 Tax=Clonorchis sinensis TaxID=79923 RepID=A0A8T1M8Y8_CLOSI|nr:hypothetical protein CSKR_109653 [Clonorchis sinensis]
MSGESKTSTSIKVITHSIGRPGLLWDVTKCTSQSLTGTVQCQRPHTNQRRAECWLSNVGCVCPFRRQSRDSRCRCDHTEPMREQGRAGSANGTEARMERSVSIAAAYTTFLQTDLQLRSVSTGQCCVTIYGELIAKVRSSQQTLTELTGYSAVFALQVVHSNMSSSNLFNQQIALPFVAFPREEDPPFEDRQDCPLLFYVVVPSENYAFQTVHSLDVCISRTAA